MRQNAFGEGQDALYVEFVDSFGVVVDLRERQLLAEPVALPFVARRVDALREQERLAQAKSATQSRVCPRKATRSSSTT